MIMDLQLSEVFHITPLIKLFEILHQFEVVIENPDLKVGKYKEERMIGFHTRLSFFPSSQTSRCFARSAGLNKPAAM